MASNSILTKELVLQKCKVERLEEVLNLNLWGKEIIDVSILKFLPNVEIISLSMNKINSLKFFQFCKKLSELYLRKNQIANLDQVAYLKKCELLRVLWLEENKICENENYRLLVIKTLPQISKLDNININENERENALKLSMEISSRNNSPKVIFKEEDNLTKANKFPEEIKIKLNQLPKLETSNYEIPRDNNQVIKPTKEKEINFNMQKISNLKGNGFLSNPNINDYPISQNDPSSRAVNFNMKHYYSNIALPTTLNNNAYNYRENIPNYRPRTNNNVSNNVNIMFAIKCLLEELTPRDLEKARISVERRLNQVRSYKYNNNV